MRKFFCSLLLFFIAITGTPTQAGDVRIFALQAMRSPYDPSLLDKKFIDGIALQVGWFEVERTPDNYVWSDIDRFVAEAKQHGKKITIHLMPLHPPEWLFSKGAEKYCFTPPQRGDLMPRGRMPQSELLCEVVPWDKVFLARWAALIREFGKRYSANPSVDTISITAPTPEMMLPGAFPGSPSFMELQRRYSKAVYLDAWKQTIDVYQAAFPEQHKIIAPGIVLFDEYFADDVVNYAKSQFGNKLWLFNAGLRADGIPQQILLTGHIAQILENYVENGGVLGLQTIWSATDDPRNRMKGTLKETLDSGMRMGASYFEIYAIDVLNPSYQSILEDLKNRSTNR